MNCFKCKKAATVKLNHLPAFCDECFMFTIEKRLRKEVRHHFLIKPHEKIAIINNGSKESKIMPYFLKSILKDMPVEIKIVNTAEGTEDKVFIPWNADDEANAFLENLFEKKETKQDGLKLLKSVSEEELQQVARILTIEPTRRERKYGDLLKTFDHQYPGSVFSIVRSIETLERIKQ